MIVFKKIIQIKKFIQQNMFLCFAFAVYNVLLICSIKFQELI